MSVFEASNGVTIADADGGKYIYTDNIINCYIADRDLVALREYIEATPAQKPWAPAQPKDIWRFELDGGRGQHALGWVALDGTWDVIDPRGGLIAEVSDPIAALIAAGFPRFTEATGIRMVAEVAS